MKKVLAIFGALFITISLKAEKTYLQKETTKPQGNQSAIQHKDVKPAPANKTAPTIKVAPAYKGAPFIKAAPAHKVAPPTKKAHG
ncbi:MAG TPA: hypothetical protein VGI61_06340 [Parafilimonas sp.]|jgi:hypothetical protein